MATIVLNIEDESMLFQIKKACSLLKGVKEVKVVKTKAVSADLVKYSGYKEAMRDKREGRVFQADGADDMFQQILGYVPC